MTSARVRMIAFCATLSAAAVPSTATAQATTVAPPVPGNAEARLAAVEAQLADVQRQLAAVVLELRVISGGGAPSTTGTSAGAVGTPQGQSPGLGGSAQAQPATGGFTLRTADDTIVLGVRGYVQSDARFYAHDRQLTSDTFLLRRVRPVLQATVLGQLEVRVMPDFGEGKTVLQDAYVDARLRPALRLRVGKFKAPVGFERLSSATDLLFVERALPTALVPNRDLGIMVHGEARAGQLTYALGLFNGVADGASSDIDEADSKDLAGRLFARPWGNREQHPLRSLGLGVSASYGTQHGTLVGPSLPVYRTSGQQTFFRYRIDLSEGPALADGPHLRWSTHASYYHGPVGLLVEHVVSQQDVRRNTSIAALTSVAWQATGSWVLTGEKSTPRSFVPRRPLDSARGTWGAFELTARINGLEVDPDAFPLFANSALAARRALAWAGGLNWYLSRAIKVATDYEHTTFTGGSPTGDRSAEHVLFTRFQVLF